MCLGSWKSLGWFFQRVAKIRYCRYLVCQIFPQKIGDPGDFWSYWIYESIPSNAGDLFFGNLLWTGEQKNLPISENPGPSHAGNFGCFLFYGLESVKVRRIPATWSSWWSFLVGVHSKYPPEIQTPIPKNIVWIVWNIAILSLHFRLSIGFLIASFFPTVARLCQQEDPHLPLRCNGAYHHLQCLLSLYDAWLCH